ncbi:TetR/AcrR family transcriptional regulator C-terminal domain-containing protein [Dactylosporangium aurantiacum]|uniref:TetR/AcrR family transcriptional regulator C-terminal domain-containing protein n=1 Tax=Dactylosporangium aurantiacum TaxID=35754 RepID=A0A9Q9INR9_9ACTN|nr:TetR/AcrR family transcriptional regulator [Dactylosporangium aurantiacum]MDG6109740.1 TetR/AcrR family transcriptional regulator [Dactylosporangium aurantiacum]UWZ56323.1 TetR/AcrR family transcriptional regulator C-terminal domain-containing protein [Dactylosporangium aurantiacum]
MPARAVPESNQINVPPGHEWDAGLPQPPWRTRRKAPVARQPLSAEAVIETALRLVDRDGLDALSMRRVAQELGTGAASLYAYFANKDELLEQLLDRIVAEIPLPVAPTDGAGDWTAVVKRSCWDSRAVFLAHRDLVKVARANIPVGPNALRYTEALLSVLRGAGIPDRIAAWGMDQLSLVIVADAIEASIHAGQGRQTEADAEPYLAQVRDYFGALPADRFPNLVAMAGAMTEGSGDERFAFAIDLMVDGLARYAGATDATTEGAAAVTHGSAVLESPEVVPAGAGAVADGGGV